MAKLALRQIIQTHKTMSEDLELLVYIHFLLLEDG